MVKNSPANSGDTGPVGLIPGLGKSPEEGDGNPLQYSHGQRNLAGGSPEVCKEKKKKVCKESDMTEHTGNATRASGYISRSQEPREEANLIATTFVVNF